MDSADSRRSQVASQWRRRPADLAMRPLWRRLNIIDLLAIALAVPAALGIVAVGGAFNAWVDLLTPWEIIFASAALVLICLVALRRPILNRWIFIGLGAASVAVAAVLMVPEWVAGASLPAPNPSAPTLRLLTLNAWERNAEIGTTADAIRQANADVVLLQELGGPVRAMPGDLKSLYPYQADCTVISQWCDLAILSKLPIVSWSHHEAAWRPPDWDRLGMVRATIATKTGPVEFITIHLMHPDVGGWASQQAAQFMQRVQDADSRRSVIAGDFNRPPWNFGLKKIDAQLPIARRTHGVSSWPNRLPFSDRPGRFPFPFLPIDQIYTGRDLPVLSVRRAPSTGSDHYGLVADIQLSPSSP